MEIKCKRCGVIKKESFFSLQNNRKKGYNVWCKVCQSSYNKEWKKNNKLNLKIKKNKKKEELKKWFYEYRKTLSCFRCKENHWACIEFHHKNPIDKTSEVSSMVRDGYSKEKIMEEISKCNIVCANCHKKIHWEIKTIV